VKRTLSKYEPLVALASGVVFGLGLVVSGMTSPAKVLGFLNIAGLAQGVDWSGRAGFWDPSLALVMAGALAVTIPGFAWARRQRTPWAATMFHWPSKKDVDGPLMAGAALFGAGWGLVGLCPGPALALATTSEQAAAFVVVMLLSMGIARWWSLRRIA
jgi:uncharacterized membrane protein YedE/YeeE